MAKFLQSRPSSALRPYIISYWAYQGNPETLLEDYTYPDGCLEIVFNIDTGVLKHDSNGSLSENPGVEIIGQLSRPYRIIANGAQLYFGVRFQPHGFSAFGPSNISCLNDQNVDARDILSSDLQALSRHCKNIDSFRKFVQRADHYFEKRASSRNNHREPYELVAACIRTLQFANCELSIAELCNHYSVSTRWLQIQFKNHVGVSPKALQKIFRFHSCIRLLNRISEQLATVAIESGYYDQAHFNREFKALSGAVPTVYRERLHPINQHFFSDF